MKVNEAKALFESGNSAEWVRRETDEIQEFLRKHPPKNWQLKPGRDAWEEQLQRDLSADPFFSGGTNLFD